MKSVEHDIDSATQLARWVEGVSLHRRQNLLEEDGRTPREVDECCPDFSCCRPELLAPPEKREMFRQMRALGDDAGVMNMLAEFLGAALRTPDPSDATGQTQVMEVVASAPADGEGEG